MTNNMDLFLKNYLHNLNLSVERVQFTQCALSWKSYNYTPTFTSIGLVMKGDGWMKVNDTDLYPSKGQLYLLPEGTLQSFSTINENPYEKYYCHFNILAGNTSIFDMIKLPLCIDIKNIDETTQLFDEFLNTFNKSDLLSLFKTKSLLLELLINYISNCSLNDIHFLNKDYNKHITEALDYIELNLKEDIKIEKLAAISGYHPSYFIKLFKETFGISPIQYINKRRLDMSIFYLTTTNLNISQIAYEVGFNSQFYFSNLFKSQIGLTPTEYRNTYQNKL